MEELRGSMSAVRLASQGGKYVPGRTVYPPVHLSTRSAFATDRRETLGWCRLTASKRPPVTQPASAGSEGATSIESRQIQHYLG